MTETELELYVKEGKIFANTGEEVQIVIHTSNGHKVNLKELLKEVGEL